MKKITLLWYPKFTLYVSSFFLFEQSLNILIHPDNFSELSFSAGISLALALVKKFYTRSNLDIYARNLISLQPEIPKYPWVFSSIILLELLLTATLKLPIIWMSFGWYIIILPEYRRIYALAVAKRGYIKEEEMELERQAKITLQIIIAYVLFRVIKGAVQGYMGHLGY